MNKNFVLSEKLRMFLSEGSDYRVKTLGEKFPVSIRKSYTYSQSIYIYPEGDYSFFTANEVICFMTLAKDLDLDSFVKTENGVVVIEVSDFCINNK